MTDQNLVRLTVNGRDYAGWLSVRFTVGIERVARDFTLGVTDRWPGHHGVAVRQIQEGALCELFIGRDQVLAGYVDATPVRYDATSITVGITGRSKTADLVDCAAVGAAQYRGQKIESIAQALAKEYGVQVRAEIDTGAAMADWQLDPAEAVFEVIDKLIKPRQIWATDNAKGELVLIKVPGKRIKTRLELGKNIHGCDAPLDFKDRFSEYVARGQAAGDDIEHGATKSQLMAKSRDATVKRKRVLSLQMQGQATAAECRSRVEFEQAYRFAKSMTVTYTVVGWRDDDGELWSPNTRVWVVDPVVGFDDELLITEVEFSLDNEGMKAAITVAPVTGYVQREQDEADRKKRGKGSKLATGGEELWRLAPQ